jgi:CTP-dependent riboflavin kinase
MSDETTGDTRSKASERLRELSEDEFIRLSSAQAGTLVDAMKQGLDTLASKGMYDEDDS